MPVTARHRIAPGRSAFRGIAWLGAAFASMAAAIGAVLVLFFAATAIVIAVMAAIVIVFAAAAVRARRTVRAPTDPDLIEAHHVGGHSWVAYGWDGRR